MGTKVKEFMAHGARFIDPTQCASAVAWCIDVTVRPPQPEKKHEYDRKGRSDLTAKVILTECGRQVSWALDDDHHDDPAGGGVAKLDAAIAELTTCRAALVEAVAVHERKRAEFKGEGDEEE